MAANGTSADNPELLGGSTTTEAYERDPTNSIIAVSIVSGLILFFVLFIWAVCWKFCKSPRSKHGNERVEAGNTSGKKEYFDQFNVNDHQLTVNSVTAIKWDEDEKGSNKSSGIDCDSHSGDSKEERKVVTSKRVFSVNKVAERQARNSVSGGNGGVVIRLPRQYADITRSLQAGDAKNFTLAIIDKHSQTVHNLDMRNYRLRKSVSPNAAVSAGTSGAHGRIAHKRHRHRSMDRNSGVQSASEFLHDSPDFSAARRKRNVMSADETPLTAESTTDFSDSADSGNAARQRSVSLSSHEEESECGTRLISSPVVKQAVGAEAAVPTNSEQEELLNDHQ